MPFSHTVTPRIHTDVSLGVFRVPLSPPAYPQRCIGIQFLLFTTCPSESMFDGGVGATPRSASGHQLRVGSTTLLRFTYIGTPSPKVFSRLIVKSRSAARRRPSNRKQASNTRQVSSASFCRRSESSDIREVEGRLKCKLQLKINCFFAWHDRSCAASCPKRGSIVTLRRNTSEYVSRENDQ